MKELYGLPSKAGSQSFLCAALLFLAIPPSLTAGGPVKTSIEAYSSSVVSVMAYDEDGKSLGHRSGFYLEKTGEVVTSYELLREAARAEVKRADGLSLQVQAIVGEDRVRNIVLLKTGRNGRPVALQQTSEIGMARIRNRTVSLGNCYIHGVEPMRGTIVEIRQLPFFGRYFKIDGSQPDLAGSLVLNMSGEPIGVVIYSSREPESFSIAVPVERALQLAEGGGREEVDDDFPGVGVEITPAWDLYFAALRRMWGGRYTEALSFLQDAVKADPGFAGAWFLKGYGATKLGRHHEAVEAYRHALRFYPDDAEARFCLGNAFGRIKCFHDAAEAYEKALAVEPTNVNVYFRLAAAYSRLGWQTKAEDTFRRAVCYQGRDLGTGGESCYDGALDRFDEIMASYLERDWADDQVAEEHFQKGITYLMLARMNLARGEYDTLRSLNRDHATGFYKLLRD